MLTFAFRKSLITSGKLGKVSVMMNRRHIIFHEQRHSFVSEQQHSTTWLK